MHVWCIAAWGGTTGIRDYSLLDSALSRPQAVYDYRPQATIHELAAAYAYGICKNHPFIDGNKRVAFLSAEDFLWANGWHLTAGNSELLATVLALAAGDLSEDQLAVWLAQNSSRKP
ncbi:MAG TPA: type II toxin-antitoxin system death-on-curing family toxin [Chthonomonadales bacterium]|nr:type II toxin-antitoxin system death-on-curing family toxin [Chthonomonadales bacterium]